MFIVAHIHLLVLTFFHCNKLGRYLTNFKSRGRLQFLNDQCTGSRKGVNSYRAIPFGRFFPYLSTHTWISITDSEFCAGQRVIVISFIVFVDGKRTGYWVIDKRDPGYVDLFPSRNSNCLRCRVRLVQMRRCYLRDGHINTILPSRDWDNNNGSAIGYTKRFINEIFAFNAEHRTAKRQIVGAVILGDLQIADL